MYIGWCKNMILFNPLKMGGLTVDEFIRAKEYYDACCTAEYVLDNYEPRPTEREALTIGYLVRDKMNKNNVCDGDSECYYIDKILEKEELWKEEPNGSKELSEL